MTDFSDALREANKGRIIRRLSWDAERHIAKMPGYTDLKVNQVTCETHGLGRGVTCDVPPYLSQYNDGVLTFWTPSNADLFATDWTAEDPRVSGDT